MLSQLRRPARRQFRKAASQTVSENTRLDQNFVRSAMEADLLDATHELDLARRWRDEQDEKALHELTSAYMRLVISVAKRFKTYGLPFPDLIQEGNVGLMQAAARFDPERGFRFSTYATWWIRSSIQDYVLRNWSIVRAGATVAHKSLFFSLKRLRARIQDFDETLSPEARSWIATQLKVREIDVDHMNARLSGSDRSLNAPLKQRGDMQWQDLLPAESATPEEEVMERRDAGTRSALLMSALDVLTSRERHVITARQLGENKETLESIGNQLGVSKERIRQIENAALLKLRAEIERLTGGDMDAYGMVP